MKCAIIFPGKVKDRWVREGLEHFQKMMQPRISLEFIAVKDERVAEPSAKDPALKREGERLLERAKGFDRRVALVAEGKSLDSLALSAQLENWKTAGSSRIAFLVGSAYGLDAAVEKSADLRLSLSALTLPHQLALLVLTEQLFRTMKIAAGESYHY